MVRSVILQLFIPWVPWLFATQNKTFLQLLTEKSPRITDLVKTLYAVYDTGSVFTYFMRKCHFGGRN